MVYWAIVERFDGPILPHLQDSIPHSVPHVIARRVYANDSLGNRDATAPSTMAVDGQAEERTDTDSSADNEFIDSLDAYCDETGRFIKQRLKAAKFRTVVGALQQVEEEARMYGPHRAVIHYVFPPQVVSFNGNSQPEIIPEHNDVYRIEWTEVEPSTKFVVGDAVSVSVCVHDVYAQRYTATCSCSSRTW